MKCLKPAFATLLLVYAMSLTEAQIICSEDKIRIRGTINNKSVTCCVPPQLRGTARCVKNGYVTVATPSSTTTRRLITINTQFFTRPKITANIITTTTPTTTDTPLIITTFTTAPATTPPTDDEDYEGSGGETNMGTVGEGQDLDNPTSAGLSIGIPLAVVAVVIVAVLLLRVKYKRKKGSIEDGQKLTANGRVFVKPMGGTSPQNEGVYQDFEQNVSTSPPLDTYDSLHLYGNVAENPHTYEQVPEKRDPLSYESLHVYTNSKIGQADYDSPTPRVMYANIGVHTQR